jgi:hypothetical protein
MEIKAAFNPDFVKFLQADRASGGAVTNLTVDDSKSGAGTIGFSLKLDPDNAAKGKLNLISMQFSGVKPGVSYLVFLDSRVKSREGSEINAQKSASRLVVK